MSFIFDTISGISTGISTVLKFFNLDGYDIGLSSNLIDTIIDHPYPTGGIISPINYPSAPTSLRDQVTQNLWVMDGVF